MNLSWRQCEREVVDGVNLCFYGGCVAVRESAVAQSMQSEGLPSCFERFLGEIVKCSESDSPAEPRHFERQFEQERERRMIRRLLRADRLDEGHFPWSARNSQFGKRKEMRWRVSGWLRLQDDRRDSSFVRKPTRSISPRSRRIPPRGAKA